jgi:hypothetical protein
MSFIEVTFVYNEEQGGTVALANLFLKLGFMAISNERL